MLAKIMLALKKSHCSRRTNARFLTQRCVGEEVCECRVGTITVSVPDFRQTALVAPPLRLPILPHVRQETIAAKTATIPCDACCVSLRLSMASVR